MGKSNIKSALRTAVQSCAGENAKVFMRWSIYGLTQKYRERNLPATEAAKKNHFYTLKSSTISYLYPSRQQLY